MYTLLLHVSIGIILMVEVLKYCGTIYTRYNPEESLKLDLRETGIDGAQLAQDRVWWQAFVNTVMNLRVP
jgi:hypothetical protein